MSRTGFKSLAAALVALVIGANASATGFSDFSLFSAAAGPLTTEGFESPPFGFFGSVAPSQTNLGVTWTSASEMFVTDFFQNSGSFSLTDNDSSVAPIDSITATLPDNVFAVGAFFDSQNEVRMTAFDSMDNEIEFITNGDTSLDNQFTFSGLVTDTAIAKVVFQSLSLTDADDDFVIDDFSFGGAAVPAPVALPAGIALLGMLGMKRRGRNAA